MLDMDKEKSDKMEWLPTLPLDRRFSTAVASDSTIYVMGGVGGRGPDPLRPYHDEVYCFGYYTTKWIAASPMLDGAMKPMAVAVDGRIFLYHNERSQVFDGAKWDCWQGPQVDPKFFSYLPPALADPSNHRILCCISLEHDRSSCSLHAYYTNEEDKTRSWKCINPCFVGQVGFWCDNKVIVDNVIYFHNGCEFYAYDLDQLKWLTVLWANEEPEKDLFYGDPMDEWNWEWEILVHLGMDTLCLARKRPFIDDKVVFVIQCLTFKVKKKGDTISASELSLKQFTIGGFKTVEDYLVL